MDGGSQGASHLLKFTTPLGMPVGVLKAGSSFSPSLMAFTRNTCGERSKGTESELGGVVTLTLCCSQGWMTGLGRGTLQQQNLAPRRLFFVVLTPGISL